MLQSRSDAFFEFSFDDIPLGESFLLHEVFRDFWRSGSLWSEDW